MPKRTRNHDTWLYGKLTDPKIASNYVNAALEDSPEMFLIAMRNVAEAHKMVKVAEGAGINRENLYRAFSKQGNPTLMTLTSVLEVMGLEFSVRPKPGTEDSNSDGPIGSKDVIVTENTRLGFIGQSESKSTLNYLTSWSQKFSQLAA
jgi:probable addiction module antidote protein